MFLEKRRPHQHVGNLGLRADPLGEGLSGPDRAERTAVGVNGLRGERRGGFVADGVEDVFDAGQRGLDVGYDVRVAVVEDVLRA